MNPLERRAQVQKADRKLKDTLVNVGGRHQLPPQVLVLIEEDTTGIRFGAFVEIEYVEKEQGIFHHKRTTLGELVEGVTPTQVIDTLLENNPGTPFVCDEQIARELSQDVSSVVWVDDGHFQLLGRPGGVVDVLTPYNTNMVRGDGKSAQIYQE